MDLVNRNQQSFIFPPPTHSSDTSFPIIVIAIIGILATAFLLVSYYIFVIKCCLNWHRIDLLGRFSFSRSRPRDDPLMIYSPAIENRGLDESAIRLIPIFQFKKEGKKGSFCECAVCLNEFQEEEKLRIMPNCSHVFHIDCIDVWLQNNANCPLCRTSVSITTTNQIIAPSSSPQDLNTYGDNFIGGDEDFVVIELQEENFPDQQSLLRRRDQRMNNNNNSGELLSAQLISPSPRRKNKERKFHHVSSMGDECINIRERDDQFSIQPIRRSFSMDSSTDRQLYLSIQAIVQQSRHGSEVFSPNEGCSNRVRRSFFPFGHGRGSRSAVLPIHLEP